eukprot:424128_1
MGNSYEKEENKNDTIQNESQRIEKIIDEKRATYNNPLFPLPSKETIQKFVKMAADIGEDNDFYETKYYHDLIPYEKNINWPFSPLKLVGATVKEHQELLDKIVIPEDEHKYTKDIQTALDSFNKWRKWKENDPNGWVYKKKDHNVSHFLHTESKENLHVSKGESVIVYPTSVVAGILLNGKHRQKYDLSAGTDTLVEAMSMTSFVIHSIIKTPMIIANRDICCILFVYCFRDGSMIMGSKSIRHDKVPIKSTPVRANITQIWHIRPFYEQNIQQSRVTYYLQMDLCGSVPYSTSNGATLDAPQAIYNVAKYIKSIHYELPKRGTLHIPPYPMLKNMGIDIGWMDIEKDKIEIGVKNEFSDDIKEAYPTLIVKEYVFKKLDEENNNIVCLDKDFNDVVFDLSLSKSDILEKINGVIDEGKKEKKDVMIIVTEKMGKDDNDKVMVVSDAKVA